MKIEIDEGEKTTTIIPEKMYPKGYDLEITLCEDKIVFSIGTTNKHMMNVQIDKEEMKTILTIIKALGEIYV